MFGKNEIYTWSHENFDAIILSSAFKACSVKSPFPYKNFRDIRTLTDLAQLDLKKTFTDKSGPQKDHNALHDCIFQVKYCSESFKTLTNTKPA
jgi:exodeoxyribonuclease VIII